MRMRQREADMKLPENIASAKSPVLPPSSVPALPSAASPPDEWNIDMDTNPLNIWIIQDTPMKWPSQLHGIFYTNDSYIILIKNQKYHHLIIWFGSEVSKMDRNFALLKAHELSGKFNDVLVSVETCFKESMYIVNLFNIRVILNGKFALETHKFHNKTFKLKRNAAIEFTDDMPEESSENFLYWGKDIVCCLSDPSRQMYDAVVAMITIYNVTKCESFIYDSYDKYLARVKNMHDDKIERKLKFVGDDLSLKLVCISERFNKQLISNGKLYVLEKYVNDELVESIVYETLKVPTRLSTIFRTKCWELLTSPIIHYLIEKVGINMQDSISLSEYIF